MPGIQVLPPNPGFGSQLGQALGTGTGQGISQALGQHFEQKQKQAQMNQLLTALGINPQQASDQGAGVPQASQAAPGATQTQQALGQPQESVSNPNKAIAAEILGQKFGFPHLGSTVAKIEEGKANERRGLEKEYLKVNLGSFKESQQKLPELKNTDLRLNRLDKLSKSEKLPGPLFARMNITEGGKVRFPALFSKEGQEFVKLITDSAKGAKDTFGSRITNFELDTFLQSLPSLLQSPEGREAVLRDLKIMNDINKLHHEAVVDVSKQAGFRVDPAQFESLVQERIGPQVQRLSQQFVSPESVSDAKPLTQEIMQDFLKKSPGKNREERIENAKKMAREQGYQVQ